LAVASPMPELAPVTTATRFFPPIPFTGITLINVLSSRSAPQRPDQQHRRVSLRGKCVLLPRILPLLTFQVWPKRPSGTRTKDARALD
jgi:hypothetical protein